VDYLDIKDIKMTLKEIKSRIKYIKSNKRDNESAHASEDQLFFDFIKHVASLDIPLSILAKEVLKTDKIKFERWYS
jgi:hypothetical protein